MTTNFISFPHPRILIVENEEGTVANLKGKLKRAIPNVSVDSAANVTEGQNKLNAAYDSLRFYTIVILDFKLPLDCTSATEIGDFSLWFLRDLCPETLVIHMTAMPDDVDFQRMRPSMETFASSLRIYFGKDEYEWAEKLVAACAKHVEQKRIHFHSDRLRMDFDRLFGPHSGDRLSRSSGRSDTPRGDQSLSLE
ncbi:MAG: hypothetical protein JWM68_4150, partial [Verrucomicrobiales bacterium]|nr:hypothetical protein [Verrucomicrobiales bacterium]